MVIFARKHFSSRMAGIFAFFIHLAIYFRAFLSISKRVISQIILPLLDALLIFAGFLLITPFWENLRFSHPRILSRSFFTICSTRLTFYFSCSEFYSLAGIENHLAFTNF